MNENKEKLDHYMKDTQRELDWHQTMKGRVALITGASPNFFALSVAKASVESLVRNLAEELGPSGIRVNAVGGGMILTDVNAFLPQTLKDQMAQRTPLRRNGRPEEVASAILFLASHQAAFITGAYPTVDGGNFIL